MSRLLIGRGAVALVGVGSGGGLYGYQRAKDEFGEDALERMISHERVAIPAILEYKLCELKYEKLPAAFPGVFPKPSEEDYALELDELHKKWAPLLFDKFMELGGFYYKSGQKVAANQGGVVPPHYVDMFQPFLNDIPPRDIAKVREVIEGELNGEPLESVFSWFEETPLGCASIGQAHRARLKSDGRRVVVKVQNPEAERTFVGDVFALRVLVDNFFPQMTPAFDEIQRQFATEFDYRGECANAQEIRHNLLEKRGELFPEVIVPRVFPELCTKRLMVMEEVYPSIPLHHALDRMADSIARSRGITKEQFIRQSEDEIREQAASGTQLYPSISQRAYDRYIRLDNARRALGRAISALPFLGSRENDVPTTTMINAAKLVDLLFKVHGHEILVDGCFNADPHPGNILYLEGKLGLIDYGQVKRLTESERLAVARVIVLVGAAIKLDPRTDPDVDPESHARAKASVARCMSKLGGRMTRDDPEVAYEMGTVYFGRCDAAWLYPRNLIQFADEMQRRDPLKSLDDVEYFVMTCQATLMLRGLAEVLRQPRNLAEVWKPLARQALAEKGLLADLDAEILSWTTKVEDAPPPSSA